MLIRPLFSNARFAYSSPLRRAPLYRGAKENSTTAFSSSSIINKTISASLNTNIRNKFSGFCYSSNFYSTSLNSKKKSENENERKFLWRTTDRRFIDFCLSPEEEKKLKELHERINASPCSFISKEEVLSCLLQESKEGEKQQKSLLGRLYHIGSYIFSPRKLEEDGRRLLLTAIPVYEDISFTEKNFGISEAAFNGRIYFLLLHLWCLHCALQQAGAETLKIKLWEAFWDFLTNLLLEDGVSEFKVPSVLRGQQFVSLGFCVSLDEAFEDEDAGPAGQLAYRLWMTVFEAAEAQRESRELLALTTYALRARRFALQLPPDALQRGAFRWPSWPPGKRQEEQH